MQNLEGMHYGSEMEQIHDCLECKKLECTNCKAKAHKVGGTKPSKMYKYHGKLYSIRQLSSLSGKSISGLLHRIRLGGVEFAMSDYRKPEEYLKMKKEPEKQ